MSSNLEKLFQGFTLKARSHTAAEITVASYILQKIWNRRCTMREIAEGGLQTHPAPLSKKYRALIGIHNYLNGHIALSHFKPPLGSLGPLMHWTRFYSGLRGHDPYFYPIGHLEDLQGSEAFQFRHPYKRGTIPFSKYRRALEGLPTVPILGLPDASK